MMRAVSGGLPLSGGTVTGPLAINPTYVGFWTDKDGATGVKNVRLRERVFVGNAVNLTDASGTAGNNSLLLTSINGTTPGATFIPRDSQLTAMSDRGVIGVSGGSRASDGADLVPLRAPIGVSGFIINDTVAAQAAWAFYADIQHQPSNTSAATYGLEVAAKNKGTDQSGDAYGTSFGVFGVWLNPGGDPSYGGGAAAPSNAGIVFVNNGNTNATWNKGIIFADGSLTKTGNGTSTALSMGQGATLQWLVSAGVTGGRIRSDVSIAGRDFAMVFQNNLVLFQSNSIIQSFEIVHQNGITTTNRLRVTDAATGGAPALSAIGTDTDVDLILAPQGAGLLQASNSASWSANGSVATALSSIGPTGAHTTVQEWFTVKNASGVTRYIPAF